MGEHTSGAPQACSWHRCCRLGLTCSRLSHAPHSRALEKLESTQGIKKHVIIWGRNVASPQPSFVNQGGAHGGGIWALLLHWAHFIRYRWLWASLRYWCWESCNFYNYLFTQNKTVMGRTVTQYLVWPSWQFITRNWFYCEEGGFFAQVLYLSFKIKLPGAWDF